MSLTTNKGIELIQEHEGLRLVAYRDSVGVLTIGYGHTGGVYEGQKISHAKAVEYLREDLTTAQNAVRRFVLEKGIPLQPNQFDALVSLVFNVGSGSIFTKKYDNGYQQGSTLYNRLLMLDFSGAAERFTDFRKAGGRELAGLLKRREQERDLFLKKKAA
jgi:lysozyme